MENDTVFSKIIRGEIPATKVYEDSECLAFLDINPVSKGHTLLIPKIGYGKIEVVPDEVLSFLIKKTKEITIAMKEALDCDFVQIGIVGKDIPEHFHIHIIPRMQNDNVDMFPHISYEDGEKEVYANKIGILIK